MNDKLLAFRYRLGRVFALRCTWYLALEAVELARSIGAAFAVSRAPLAGFFLLLLFPYVVWRRTLLRLGRIGKAPAPSPFVYTMQ